VAVAQSKRKGARTTTALPSSREVLQARETLARPAYPRFAELRGQGTLLAQARALAEKLLCAGAAAGLTLAASGCEPPQCQATRVEEVRVHGDTALTEVGSFQLKDAARELGIGLGVVTHPLAVSMPMAGAMVAVYPYPPEEDAGPAATPDAGTP
jgi:hypothetical protein